MLDVFNIAKPQNCDIQTFVGPAGINDYTTYSWNKPRGVSHVYMMLIGGGGQRATGNAAGGGSGAVTVWYGAAQHVPDILVIQPGFSSQSSLVRMRPGGDAVYLITLLTAAGASENSPGVAMTANNFTASGFFNSVTGQGGTGSADQVASPTTFLSGGSGGIVAQTVNANYGYSQSSGRGFFQLQPIIVGLANNALSAQPSFAAIGCGGSSVGGVSNTGYGGPGMILIASW